MCYEFDEMYRQAREAEVARRKKLADELKRPDRFSPAKPAAPQRGVKEREPIPA